MRIFANNALTNVVTAALSEASKADNSTRFRVDFGERIVDLGEYDVVLRIAAANSSDGRKIASWRHVLVGAPSYFNVFGNPKKPLELKNHSCLHYGHYPYGTSWKFVRSNGDTERASIHPNVVSNNVETLRRFAIDGRGLFLAPSFSVAADVAATRLSLAMPEYSGTEHSLHAIVPKRAGTPARVEDLIDRLSERLSNAATTVCAQA
jgi:DNA-binding transcriptional LysR family regulator